MESGSRMAGVMAGAGNAIVSILMLQAVTVPALVGLWDFSGLRKDQDIAIKLPMSTSILRRRPP